MFPHKAGENKVDDPIFGHHEHSEDVPYYATVHPDTKAKYVSKE